MGWIVYAEFHRFPLLVPLLTVPPQMHSLVALQLLSLIYVHPSLILWINAAWKDHGFFARKSWHTLLRSVSLLTGL